METNNSIQKMISILNLFLSHKALRIKDICDHTGYTRPSVNRILHTLVENSYLTRDPETKRYHLGNTIYYLGQKTNINNLIQKKAKPLVDRLSAQIGYTITMSAIDEHQTIVVYKRHSNTAIALVPDIGGHRSVHCSASGKVLTAYSTFQDEIIENIVFERMTDYTITDAASYRKVLTETLTKGYAFDDEEVARGLFCIAVPVLNIDHASYSISMSGYKEEIMERLEEYISLLQEYAAKIAEVIY
jgi:DNA-binding IclR family transcriptional regulator